MNISISSIRFVVSATFLLLILLLPPLIPFHFFPCPSFWNEFVAGLLALFFWAVTWFDNSKNIEISAGIFVWLIYGLVFIVSSSLAKYSMMAPVYWEGIFFFLGCLIILGVTKLRQDFGMRRLVVFVAISMVFSGLLQSLLGVARFYGLLRFLSPYLSSLPTNRLLGLLNYPTIAGFSIWLSVYALIYLFLKRKVGYLGLVLGSFPMMWAIIATGNRSSVLYGFCVIAVSGILYLRNIFSRSHRSFEDSVRARNGIAAFVLIGVTLVPIYSGAEAYISSTLKEFGYISKKINIDNSFERKKGDFWGIRGSEFRKAIYLVRFNPWFGVGPGNYPYQSFRLDSVVAGAIREGTVNTHSHNIFSMILIEEGLAGVLVVVVGFIMLFVWWWRLREFGESFFIGTVLSAFFVFSNLEYPLWYLNFFVIFMIFCALLSPSYKLKIDHGWFKPMVAFLTLMVGSAVAFNIASGFYDISEVNSHDDLSGKDLATIKGYESDRFLKPFAELVYERYTFPSPKNIQDQIDMNDELIHRLPMPKALLDKALLLLFEGHKNQACQLATRAANSYPHIISEYKTEIVEYEKKGEKLPHNPALLKPCLDNGYAHWKEQWAN